MNAKLVVPREQARRDVENAVADYLPEHSAASLGSG